MRSGLIRFIVDNVLTVPEGISGEYARQFAFFRLGYAIAAGNHALYAVMFALNGLIFLTWYNVLVTGLFITGGFIWRKFDNPLWLIVPLFFGEILLHAFLATLTAGFAPLFWIVPITSVIACLVSPQISWPGRITLSALFLALMGCIGAIGLLLPPWELLSTNATLLFFLINFFGVIGTLICYVAVNQYLVLITETRLFDEFQRAEGLLRNILPDPIALRLKDGERVIANEHKNVSVVFADIVDFTANSAKLTPSELVETLNLVFSEFDILVDRHGAEKIKTIGDAYMVVVGAPDENRNHAEVAVNLALDMLQTVQALSDRTHFNVRIRIGVNSGPVVAGVIGHRKFAYDLWGDAVNVASRMESHGEPGQVLVTEITASLLPNNFSIRPEGVRDVKGKGPTPVFSVSVRKRAGGKPW